MSYYFLAASLPMLDLGSAPQMTCADFVATCSEHLTDSDLAALSVVMDFMSATPPDSDEEQAESTGFTTHPFAQSAIDHETQIRNAVATERSKRLSRDPGQYISTTTHFDAHIPGVVASALSKANPRDGEKELDKLRWAVIEDLQGTDPFSADAIIAYGIKLALAQRWSLFNEDEGRSTAESVIEQLIADRTDNEA